MAIENVVEARAIYKFFGPVAALQGANLTLQRGEVLGVVGDNGAGKSTLMKILSGVLTPSKGEIFIEGRPARFKGPKEAREKGVEMVYQHLALAGNMDIAENIYLGREPVRRFLNTFFRVIDHRAMRTQARQHLDNLRVEVKSVEQHVEHLSGGQRQAVAIARATAFSAQVVIMDEPTAALAVKEVGKVLDLIRSLKEHHVGVILISHRLTDIFAVCDRVMALYHGTNFAEGQVGDIQYDQLVGWIMGVK